MARSSGGEEWHSSEIVPNAADTQNTDKTARQAASIPENAATSDDQPDPPTVKFFQRLIWVGFSISLLWAFVLLLLVLLKRVREKRKEYESTREFFWAKSEL